MPPSLTLSSLPSLAQCLGHQQNYSLMPFATTYGAIFTKCLDGTGAMTCGLPYNQFWTFCAFHCRGLTACKYNSNIHGQAQTTLQIRRWNSKVVSKSQITTIKSSSARPKASNPYIEYSKRTHLPPPYQFYSAVALATSIPPVSAFSRTTTSKTWWTRTLSKWRLPPIPIGGQHFWGGINGRRRRLALGIDSDLAPATQKFKMSPPG
jgi:hypothetical protein